MPIADLISLLIAHLAVVVLLVGATATSLKSKSSVVSSRIGMKFDRNVLSVNVLSIVFVRMPNGNDVGRARPRTLIGRLPNYGVPIGCQDPRDNCKRGWGAFGSRKQFVDMHTC